jgi:sensor histidine kinase regulating citrate/malate metabolism
MHTVTGLLEIGDLEEALHYITDRERHPRHAIGVRA